MLKKQFLYLLQVRYILYHKLSRNFIRTSKQKTWLLVWTYRNNSVYTIPIHKKHKQMRKIMFDITWRVFFWWRWQWNFPFLIAVWFCLATTATWLVTSNDLGKQFFVSLELFFQSTICFHATFWLLRTRGINLVATVLISKYFVKIIWALLQDNLVNFTIS